MTVRFGLPSDEIATYRELTRPLVAMEARRAAYWYNETARETMQSFAMFGVMAVFYVAVFGYVAFWMRRLSPRVGAVVAFGLVPVFLGSLVVNPDPVGLYVNASFVALALGVGYRKFKAIR